MRRVFRVPAAPSVWGPSAPLAVALLASASAASAHPGHSLAQTAYLTLAPSEVRLELDFTVGEDAVAPLLAALDPNDDGQASEAETRAWAEGVLGEVSLTLDDGTADWTLDDVEVPDLALVATGSAALSITASTQRAETPGAHSLVFTNDYAPAETLRTTSIFLAPGESWSWDVVEQERSDDGAGLKVTYATSQD